MDQWWVSKHLQPSISGQSWLWEKKISLKLNNSCLLNLGKCSWAHPQWSFALHHDESILWQPREECRAHLQMDELTRICWLQENVPKCLVLTALKQKREEFQDYLKERKVLTLFISPLLSPCKRKSVSYYQDSFSNEKIFPKDCRYLNYIKCPINPWVI